MHELVHYITARFLGFSGFVVELIPIGAVLKVKDLDEATPLEDFIISISGPLFNLILAGIFYFSSYKLFLLVIYQ
jgi:stage IV sporulation protein FB